MHQDGRGACSPRSSQRTKPRVVIAPGNGCTDIDRANWYSWCARLLRSSGWCSEVVCCAFPDPHRAREKNAGLAADTPWRKTNGGFVTPHSGRRRRCPRRTGGRAARSAGSLQRGTTDEPQRPESCSRRIETWPAQARPGDVEAERTSDSACQPTAHCERSVRRVHVQSNVSANIQSSVSANIPAKPTTL